MGYAVEVSEVRKTYLDIHGKRVAALDGMSLAVPEGGVFGILGPNGAGKTTLIRLLVGLVRFNGGSVTVLGARLPTDLHRVLPRIGAIVEAPAFSPRMTVRRNMEILARISGISKNGIEQILERVGLADDAKRNAKDLSLGMRQRLAIACALVKDPELLIFDEPANGLDPEGIVQVRELIRELGAEGRTVLVSSHILSEIRLMADQVAIVSEGRTLVSGPVPSILEELDTRGAIVRLADPARALGVLEAAGMVANRMGDDHAIRVSCPPGEADRVTRALAEHGLYVKELMPDATDLEAAYLRLTSVSGRSSEGEHRDRVAPIRDSAFPLAVSGRGGGRRGPSAHRHRPCRRDHLLGATLGQGPRAGADPA
jgi:ABC-2 type transport system ATP-binding protein